MFPSLLIAAFLLAAQASPAPPSNPDAVKSAGEAEANGSFAPLDLETRARRLACACAAAKPAEAFLNGYVIDAELTLGADKRSTNDRQATIFDVKTARDKSGRPYELDGRTRIFHSANTAQCGVRFDYGKRYFVPARKTEDGDYETDFCLVNGFAGKTIAATKSE